MNPHPIVAELARIREQRGLSCLTASRESGISPGTIGRWELGHGAPLLPVLADYARSYGYRIVLEPNTPREADDPEERALALEAERLRTGGHERTTGELIGLLVAALAGLFDTRADEHQGAA